MGNKEGYLSPITKGKMKRQSNQNKKARARALRTKQRRRARLVARAAYNLMQLHRVDALLQPLDW